MFKCFLLCFYVILLRGSHCAERSLLENGAYVNIDGMYASGAVWIHENKVLSKCSIVDFEVQTIHVFLYIEPTKSYLVGWTICHNEYRTEEFAGKYLTRNDYAILITLEKFRPSFYLTGKFDFDSRDDWQVDRLDEDLEEMLDEHERNKEKCHIIYYPSGDLNNLTTFRPVARNCTLSPLKLCSEESEELTGPFLTSQEDKIRCLRVEGDDAPHVNEASVLIGGKTWGFLFKHSGQFVSYMSFDRSYSFFYEIGLKKGSGAPNYT